MQYVIMFAASVVPFLAQFLVASTARIAVALGFGTVAFAGVGLIFDSIIDKLNASASGLSPHIATFITLLGIDTAFNIMLSAGVFLMVLKGVNRNGDMRKTVWRKPGDKSDVDWGA
ncbi:Protein of unknown function (DUF2523) [Shewanella psychrophila]|uniref:DUF2523 domain-containing protein n=1 Tax=Shewanella psychrophila TaxID=225848 RepID=A0A1S6HKR9_9GAMM|nr:DUF2523 domain-containing protein [Shewanella psychrophila]AQS36126.1 Protein of unknown function (DUF2523) [Shewanella psychrophila]